MRARTVATWLATITAVAIVFVGVYALVFRRGRARTSQAWADARGCLLGPPLDPGESVAERVARVRYARPKVPRPQPRVSRYAAPVAKVPSWPTQCRDEVATLAQRRSSGTELADLARRLGENLTAIDDAVSSSPVVLDVDLLDSLTAAAAGLDVLPPGAGHPIAEISPKPMIDRGALIGIFERFPGFSGVFSNRRDEQGFDSIDLFGIGKAECTVSPSDGVPLSSLTCSPGSRKKGFTHELVAADGARFRFVGAATRPPAGKPLDPSGEKPDATRVERVKDDHAESLVTLQTGLYQGFFVDHRLVWSEDRRRWSSRSIRTEPPWLSAPELLLDEEGFSDKTCRGPSRSVLLLSRDRPLDPPGASADPRAGFRLFFGQGEGWGAPVNVPLENPPVGRSAHASAGTPTLSCGDHDARVGTARVTWTDDLISETEATRWVCVPGHCTEEHVGLGYLAPVQFFTGGNWTSDPDGMDTPLVVDLGPRTLVVWLSYGAVWARLAPFAELGSAPDRIIAGGGRFRLTWGQDAVITRDRTALVFIAMSEGAHDAVLTVRADSEGDLRVLGIVPPSTQP